MNQQTFTDIEYSMRRKITKQEAFLEMMESIIPWGMWIEMIKPEILKCTRRKRVMNGSSE